MADSSYPFSSGPGSSVTEDQWSRMASLWAPDGVVPGSPAITLGAGLTFTLPVGFGAFTDGFMYEVVSEAVQKAAADNTNSLPRRDRLVLRKDLVAKTITPVIIQGTPSSGTPPLPTVTANDMPLAYATAPGSGSAQNYSSLVIEHGYTDGENGDKRPRVTGQLRRSDGLMKLAPGGGDLQLYNATATPGWNVAYSGRGIAYPRSGRFGVETLLQTQYDNNRYVDVRARLVDPAEERELLPDTAPPGWGATGGYTEFYVPAGKTFQLLWNVYSEIYSGTGEVNIRGSRVQVTWLGP